MFGYTCTRTEASTSAVPPMMRPLFSAIALSPRPRHHSNGRAGVAVARASEKSTRQGFRDAPPPYVYSRMPSCETASACTRSKCETDESKHGRLETNRIDSTTQSERCAATYRTRLQ